MSEKKQYSPLPWKLFLNGSQIGDKDGGGICAMWRYSPELSEEDNAEAKANAAHIVNCVNNHERLVLALKDMLDTHNSQSTEGEEIRKNAALLLNKINPSFLFKKKIKRACKR
jgi:hypothetical protein